VQPQIAAIPGGALVGVWEQDRWTGPGARAILTARSADGGATWSTPGVLQFSACGGGNGPGAAYDRASDPWVSFGGSGVVYASALAFSANGFLSQSGLSAVIVARSADGGATWAAPVVVQADTNPGTTGPYFFNDRDSIASDANGNVYLVWDRITTDTTTGGIPGYLALSNNAGATWATKVLYDPGPNLQSFNNEIAILPSGVVLDIFTLVSLSTTANSLQLIKSSDQGATWSAATPIANIAPVGTTNPIPNGMQIRDSSLMAQNAVDPATGAIAVVWQQSFGSAVFDGIALSVSQDGGTT
jgi:hypothetical protein